MNSIEKLVADVLRLPENTITDATRMKHTAEWDSLKHMELIVAIEQALNIEFSGDDIAEMTSVAAIKAIVKRVKAA